MLVFECLSSLFYFREWMVSWMLVLVRFVCSICVVRVGLGMVGEVLL